MDPTVQLLLRVLDQAFGAKGWHGTTLAGSVRGLTLEQALWRPAPSRHNIWELVLHTAYWKYAVRRRLTQETERGGFPRKPADWPAVPDAPTPKAWRADVALLKDCHAALRDAVRGLNRRSLATRSPSGEWTYAEMIHGVAAHDCYHTGQIQLLKRLQRR